MRQHTHTYMYTLYIKKIYKFSSRVSSNRINHTPTSLSLKTFKIYVLKFSLKL